MASEMMRHFEQDLLPQVIELLKQTPKPTPETGLLAYITEQICNVVYFDEVTNDIPVNIDMPDFMQVAKKYTGYINYYAIADYFLNTSLSFASLVYDEDSRDKVQQTNDLLMSFITEYVPKTDVITHLNTPEAVKLDIIIKELQKYKGKVSADNVDFIIKSMYAVKTIIQKIYLDVLRSLGFGEVAIIYIDLCNGTNKERSRYNTKLYDEVIENMLNFYTSLALRNIVPPENFLHWVFDESRYIRFTTESIDKAYVDKQKILNVVATSDLSDISMQPYFTVIDDMSMYVNSFLGSDPDLANKVISNLGKYDSKELDLLQAVGKANQSNDLTEEQHIMLERLIPKDIYANFIFAVYERRQDLYNAFLVN